VRARDGRAALPVRLELYIRTENREAWICRESDGVGVWYQGHDKKRAFYPDEIPEPNVNGLLLYPVAVDGTVYTAVNVDTTYRVSRRELKVSGDQNYTEPVLQARPPA
jgi:hypothetical protein